MEQARSFCSAAVILTAAVCYLAPSRPAPPVPPAPRPEARPAAAKQAKAARPRPDNEEDEAIRRLQQQLSWGRCSPAAGGKHDANCRCRQGARPAVLGADGVFDPDMRSLRAAPARSPTLPRPLRREGRP